MLALLVALNVAAAYFVGWEYGLYHRYGFLLWAIVCGAGYIPSCLIYWLWARRRGRNGGFDEGGW